MFQRCAVLLQPITMSTFYSKIKSQRDLHVKDNMDTKPEKDQGLDLSPLTPPLLRLPLRLHSSRLRQCLTDKLHLHDSSVCKLMNSENFWLMVSDIYYPAVDTLTLNRVMEERDNLKVSTGRAIKSVAKMEPSFKDNRELEDGVFLFQTKFLAERNGFSSLSTIDEVIQLWEQELTDLSINVDTQLQSVSTSITEAKTELQRLNVVLHPVSYRPEIVHFEFMELEDMEARKCQEEVMRKQSMRTVCCVCNLEELEGNIFVTCGSCKSTLHNKCYPFKIEDVEDGGSFMCWSCLNPRKKEEFYDKCCLCNIVGGVMGPCEMTSDNEMVAHTYHPPFTYELEEDDSNFLTIRKTSNSLPVEFPFRTRVHLSCAYWHSECFWSRTDQQFDGVLKIKEKKWKLGCRVCEEPHGASIECSCHGCSKSFHAECARRAKVSMCVVKLGKINKEIFCDKHRIKHSYEKLVERRLQSLSALRRLYMGIERLLGPQGFIEKKPRKKDLKVSKSKARERERERDLSEDENQVRFCVCRSVYSGEKMIECEKCLEWYHFECVLVADPHHFVCPACHS